MASAAAPALAPHHLCMLRDESGIADEVIGERGYRSIDGASGYTELKALGYSKQQVTPSIGLLLPLHTTDGRPQARLQAIAQKSPSALQLAYLAALGDDPGAPPATMAEASARIDGLLSDRRGGRQ